MTSPTHPLRSTFLRLALVLAAVCVVGSPVWRVSASGPSGHGSARLKNPGASQLRGVLPAGMAATGAAPSAAIPAVTATTGSTGSATPAAVENKQPTQAMRWIIATQGIFPSDGGGNGSGFADETPYISEVRLLSYDTALPQGWLECNGALLQVIPNAALFSLIGYTYGGGGSTFALPDLRGRVPVGIGQGAGMSDVLRGQKFGAETNTLTTASLPAHTHSVNSGATGSTGSGLALVNAQPSLGLRMGVVSNSFDISNVGTVRFFAGSIYPTGFVACDGRSLSKFSFFALHAKLGYTFGGSGNNFNAPDLRGRTPIGKGQGDGLTNRTLGQQVGSENITFSVSDMPQHTHSHPGGATGPAGGAGQSHSTMQPSLVLRPALSLTGSYNGFESFGTPTPAVGEVRFFAYNGELPTTNLWVECDGSVHPTSDFDDNYNFEVYSSLVGGTYGGDGFESVGLPDLRGRATAGIGSGPGLTARTLAQKFGLETVPALGINNLPAHTHELTTDMEITKKDSTDPVPVGSSFTYTLRIYNRGPSIAHNVTVTDAVPAGLTVTGVSLHGTSDFTGTGCAPAGNSVTCNLGTMRVFDNTFDGAVKKGKVIVNITATASQLGQYTNVAGVDADEADTNASDNIASQTTTVLGVASVEVTPDAVPGGSNCQKALVKVTLTGVAPYDTFVSLSDDLTATTNIPALPSPLSLRIPQGQLMATLPIDTSQVTATQAGQVTASFGDSSASAPLTVKPIGVRHITVSPGLVEGGLQQATATVTLDCTPSSPVSVVLKSSKLFAAKFIDPTTSTAAQPVTALMTTKQANFTIETYSVGSNVGVNISAEGEDNVQKNSRLDVLAPTP